jgi:hypothetical protein
VREEFGLHSDQVTGRRRTTKFKIYFAFSAKVEIDDFADNAHLRAVLMIRGEIAVQIFSPLTEKVGRGGRVGR